MDKEMQNSPGLATNGKRGTRPDVCTIQVKEPKDASPAQKAYYARCTKSKTHFMNRAFKVPGQDTPVVLGHWGCMAVLETAFRVEEAGVDVMELLQAKLPKDAKSEPATKAETKPEKKAKAEPKKKVSEKAGKKPEKKAKKVAKGKKSGKATKSARTKK